VKPLVSILIPAYNAEAWIADTIQSALQQTWPEKEVIVVDDGSSDQTLAIARRFAMKGVVVVSQKNRGAAVARNTAYSKSRGDYIQWLDADDLLGPDKIASQLQALKEYPSPRTLFSSPWGTFIYRTRNAQFNPTPLWCDLSPREWLMRQLRDNIFIQPAAWLVSRELTEAAGPWDTRLSFNDDGEYFGRVVAASERIQFVPEAKTYYRRTGGSSLSTIGRSNRKLESLFLSMELHINHALAIDGSEPMKAACVRFLQQTLIFLYPERLDLVEKAKQLAEKAGGRLELPRLAWKYHWIQRLFGWGIAKRIETSYNKFKSFLLRSWDKAMLHWENSTNARSNFQAQSQDQHFESHH
jgi:glycosyltransferase involved in cell wall biosynthesis